MKPLTSPSSILLIAICALLLAGANQTLHARNAYYYPTDPKDYPSGAAGRHFIIGYSPTLGINLGVVVRIDGREAGAITKGHTCTRRISVPAAISSALLLMAGYYDALEMTLDVRPGQTYSYVAKYNRYHMVLLPAVVSR